MFLGDIETNPGPFWKRGEDPIDNLQTIIDDQADELKDLKDTIDEQNDTIEDLRAKISDLADKLSQLSDVEKTNTENALKCERMIETVQKESDRNFDKFSENDSKLGRELLQQKVIDINFSALHIFSTRFIMTFLIYEIRKCRCLF